MPDLTPPPVPTRQIGAVAAPERERSAGSNMLVDAAIHEVLPAEPSGGNPITEKQLDWSIKTGDEVRGSATYAGGSIYIGSYDGNLYALDDSDGAVRWRFKSQRGIVSRPAVHSEMVVFGSEDKTVYAVSR
jgi:outer membrane protein assembly factor BamB